MEIIYTNSGGEKITLRPQRPFFLQRVDGTGSVKQAITTFKAPNQDGAFYISGTLDMRNITVEGTVVADTVSQAYEQRKNLLRIFTPKQQGTLTYRDKRIACVVEEASFAVGNGERSPAFFISLLCPSPFFEDMEEIRVELAAWSNCFSFVLEIPATGIVFGSREPSQIMTVDNEGDVSCGCTIVFKALGSVVNPELMHLDTGEVIRLNKAMVSGEEIRITTHFAAKQVLSTVGGETSNAFATVDTASTFLQLLPGRNTLRYGAASNLDLLEVSIYYRPQYLGV
jgi:hypothetical protein